MSLVEMVFPLLVPPVDVLIRTLPHGVALAVAVAEPRIVQFVTRLLVAPLIRRSCLCWRLPKLSCWKSSANCRPSSNHQWSRCPAPLRSINGLPAAIAPETVLTPVGVIRTKV